MPKPRILLSMRAGFAKNDITPGPELSLLGYDFRGKNLLPGNDGPLDSLYVRAIALANNTKEAGPAVLLLSFDLALLEDSLVRKLRSEISRATAIPETRIHLCCTHTHSAPLPRLSSSDEYSEEDPQSLRDFLPQEEENNSAAYLRLVIHSAVQAAQQALGLLIPVEVFSHQSLTGLGYNRRIHNGSHNQPDLCWNQEEFPHLQPQPSPDPWLSLLILRPVGGGSPFLLWGTGIHPVTLGKTSRMVSADWPGQTCRLLEEPWQTERIAFFQGASGEVHPWLATGDNPRQVEWMAQAMAAQIHLLGQTARPWYRSSKTPLWEQQDRSWPLTGDHPIPLSLLRIGPFYCPLLPLELFASLSATLRRQWPVPIMPITLANGWHAYWPDQEAFAQGGYEVEVALRQGRHPGDGEKLLQILDQMHQKFPSTTKEAP